MNHFVRALDIQCKAQELYWLVIHSTIYEAAKLIRPRQNVDLTHDMAVFAYMKMEPHPDGESVQFVPSTEAIFTQYCQQMWVKNWKRMMDHELELDKDNKIRMFHFSDKKSQEAFQAHLDAIVEMYPHSRMGQHVANIFEPYTRSGAWDKPASKTTAALHTFARCLAISHKFFRNTDYYNPSFEQTEAQNFPTAGGSKASPENCPVSYMVNHDKFVPHGSTVNDPEKLHQYGFRLHQGFLLKHIHDKKDGSPTELALECMQELLDITAQPFVPFQKYCFEYILPLQKNIMHIQACSKVFCQQKEIVNDNTGSQGTSECKKAPAQSRLLCPQNKTSVLSEQEEGLVKMMVNQARRLSTESPQVLVTMTNEEFGVYVMSEMPMAWNTVENRGPTPEEYRDMREYLDYESGEAWENELALRGEKRSTRTPFRDFAFMRKAEVEGVKTSKFSLHSVPTKQAAVAAGNPGYGPSPMLEHLAKPSLQCQVNTVFRRSTRYGLGNGARPAPYRSWDADLSRTPVDINTMKGVSDTDLRRRTNAYNGDYQGVHDHLDSALFRSLGIEPEMDGKVKRYVSSFLSAVDYAAGAYFRIFCQRTLRNEEIHKRNKAKDYPSKSKHTFPNTKGDWVFTPHPVEQMSQQVAAVEPTRDEPGMTGHHHRIDYYRFNFSATIPWIRFANDLRDRCSRAGCAAVMGFNPRTRTKATIPLEESVRTARRDQKDKTKPVDVYKFEAKVAQISRNKALQADLKVKLHFERNVPVLTAPAQSVAKAEAETCRLLLAAEHAKACAEAAQVAADEAAQSAAESPVPSAPGSGPGSVTSNTTVSTDSRHDTRLSHQKQKKKKAAAAEEAAVKAAEEVAAAAAAAAEKKAALKAEAAKAAVHAAKAAEKAASLKVAAEKAKADTEKAVQEAKKKYAVQGVAQPQPGTSSSSSNSRSLEVPSRPVVCRQGLWENNTPTFLEEHYDEIKNMKKAVKTNIEIIKCGFERWRLFSRNGTISEDAAKANMSVDYDLASAWVTMQNAGVNLKRIEHAVDTTELYSTTYIRNKADEPDGMQWPRAVLPPCDPNTSTLKGPFLSGAQLTAIAVHLLGEDDLFNDDRDKGYLTSPLCQKARNPLALNKGQNNEKSRVGTINKSFSESTKLYSRHNPFRFVRVVREEPHLVAKSSKTTRNLLTLDLEPFSRVFHDTGTPKILRVESDDPKDHPPAVAAGQRNENETPNEMEARKSAEKVLETQKEISSKLKREKKPDVDWPKQDTDSDKLAEREASRKSTNNRPLSEDEIASLKKYDPVRKARRARRKILEDQRQKLSSILDDDSDDEETKQEIAKAINKELEQLGSDDEDIHNPQGEDDHGEWKNWKDPKNDDDDDDDGFFPGKRGKVTQQYMWTSVAADWSNTSGQGAGGQGTSGQGATGQGASGSSRKASGSSRQPSGSSREPTGSSRQPSGSSRQPSGSSREPSGMRWPSVLLEGRCTLRALSGSQAMKRRARDEKLHNILRKLFPQDFPAELEAPRDHSTPAKKPKTEHTPHREGSAPPTLSSNSDVDENEAMDVSFDRSSAVSDESGVDYSCRFESSYGPVPAGRQSSSFKEKDARQEKEEKLLDYMLIDAEDDSVLGTLEEKNKHLQEYIGRLSDDKLDQLVAYHEGDRGEAREAPDSPKDEGMDTDPVDLSLNQRICGGPYLPAIPEQLMRVGQDWLKSQEIDDFVENIGTHHLGNWASFLLEPLRQGKKARDQRLSNSKSLRMKTVPVLLADLEDLCEEVQDSPIWLYSPDVRQHALFRCSIVSAYSNATALGVNLWQRMECCMGLRSFLSMQEAND